MPAPPQTSSLHASADPGHETHPVDALLAAHDTLVARIKLSFGVDRATFARDVLPLIRAYADYVYWLPATASDAFDRPGGLFQLGLETAFYAVQGTDAHIFSGKLPISVRRHLEPRWRRATFIAGLCSELHRAVGQVSVFDEKGDVAWPSLGCPLAHWLAQRNARRYHVHWRAQAVEARSLGLLVLPQVVPVATLHFLAQDNEVVLPHLLASVGGLPPYHGRDVLHHLVRRAFALVMERDRTAHATASRTRAQGPHQVRYLVEGLQWLVAHDATWRPNQEKSRVWYGSDGLYLVWPGAGHDLHRLLEGEQIAGMPDGPDAILERLDDTGLIERTRGGDAIWPLRPPGVDTPLQAIKIALPALLLRPQETAPPALPQALASAPPSPAPDTAPSPVEQLSLIEPAAPPPASAPDTDRAERTEATPSGWRLKAPLRLNAAVRHALATILAEPSQAIVPDPEADALFVPLRLVETHRIAPALAMRALADAGMLAVDAAGVPVAVQRPDADGRRVTGIHLPARFVDAQA